MPEVGESITEGTITRWLKQEGDRVEVDEPLFEISTDKVDTEVPSPVAGVLKTIKVQVDETVEVGAELAVIEQDGEAGGQAEGGGEEQAEGEAAAEGEGEGQAEAAEGEGREQEATEAAEAQAGSEEAGGGEQRAATAEREDGEARPRSSSSPRGRPPPATARRPR
jgi:2-oxoglutarate dehydrogenase E2 component (dihydrolipoamide succinyltransferase)